MKADEERRHRSAEETAAFGKLNMETLSAADTSAMDDTIPRKQR